jgi:hypothetical protein
MQSGPGFAPTFLYYFVSTTLITLLVISQGLPDPQQQEVLGNPFPVALLLGVLAGGLGAYFNAYEQIELPIKNRGGDLKTLTQTLTDMGYAEVKEVEQVKVYERSFPSNIFAGKLLVEFQEKSVLISGRANRIRTLKKSFKIG